MSAAGKYYLRCRADGILCTPAAALRWARNETFGLLSCFDADFAMEIGIARKSPCGNYVWATRLFARLHSS